MHAWTGEYLSRGDGWGSIEFLFRIIIVPRGRSHVKIGMAWKYLFSMDSEGEDFGERVDVRGRR